MCQTNQILRGIDPKGNTQSLRIRPCHLPVTSCSRRIQQQLLAFAVECRNHVSEPKPFSPCWLIWGSPICWCAICCRCPSINDVKGSHWNKVWEAISVECTPLFVDLNFEDKSCIEILWQDYQLPKLFESTQLNGSVHSPSDWATDMIQGPLSDE